MSLTPMLMTQARFNTSIRESRNNSPASTLKPYSLPSKGDSCELGFSGKGDSGRKNAQHGTENSHSALSLIRRVLSPKQSFESQVALARSPFIPNTIIPTTPSGISRLLKEGKLQYSTVFVKDMLGKVGKYSLEKQGFELRHLPESSIPILNNLVQLPNQNTIEARKTRELLRIMLAHRVTELARTTWGHSSDVIAVPLDAVFRNTDRRGSNVFQSVGMIHADFTDYKSALKAFPDTWGPRFKKTLPEQDYNDAEVERMVNVWIPLDNHVESDPLIAFKKDSLPLKPYTAMRRDTSTFPAQVAESSGPLKGHFLSSFGKGDCIIFDSTETPHTAVEIPGQSLNGRRSVELRFAIVKPKRK